jgi:hypothetical protein
MQEPRTRMRTAEKVAGVIAVIAALVVLNGAWVNQHSFQNVSWRVAVAGLLVFLAVIVETKLFGLVRTREHSDDVTVPDFLRAGSRETEPPVESEPTRSDGVGVGDRT